jgi:hypothetical protein
MLYFAYGSNMCTGRLQRRVPSAVVDRKAKLLGHSLRFHKRSVDGSAKGIALDTGNPQDAVWGVIFRIDEKEKTALDDAEGLGAGYIEKRATVVDDSGSGHCVLLYIAHASYVDATLLPYSWYKRFVLDGATQHRLLAAYVDTITAMTDKEDPDRVRDQRNRSIGC